MKKLRIALGIFAALSVWVLLSPGSMAGRLAPGTIDGIPQSAMNTQQEIAVPPPPFSEDIFPCSDCHGEEPTNRTVRALEDDNEEVRFAAIDAICELSLSGPQQFAGATVDFLVDMFADDIEGVRLNAIYGLQRMSRHVRLEQRHQDRAAAKDEGADAQTGEGESQKRHQSPPPCLAGPPSPTCKGCGSRRPDGQRLPARNDRAPSPDGRLRP